MRDLKNTRWMYAKAALFLAILVLASAILLLEMPSWRTVALLVLVVWSSARIYYFLFYVIERYIDPTQRFSGVGAALRYVFGTRSGLDRARGRDTGDECDSGRSVFGKPSGGSTERR